MADDPLIEVQGLSKRFCRDLRRSLAYGVRDIAAELVPWDRRPPRLRRDEFWALDEISFSLRRGEALAVVGANGAGKSTLLRVIAGLLKPDCGTVRLRAAVQPVIDLTTGLNPLLTGRENVQLGLALRGVPHAADSAAIEEVCAFAEIGEFIDAPVQSYSSGMRARLAFAVAAQTDAPLMLVDEVLAVGDIGFQRKCLQHIRRHLDQGGALLFVSHNIFQVQTVCERGIVLDHGRVVFDGGASESLDEMFSRQGETQQPAATTRDQPSGPQILGLELGAGADGMARTGQPLEIRMRYFLPESVEALCSVALWTRDLSVCIAIAHDTMPQTLARGPGERTCRLPLLPLTAGHYLLRASIVDPATLHPIALHGYSGPATPLTVAAMGDRWDAVRTHMGQLVAIESEWQ